MSSRQVRSNGRFEMTRKMIEFGKMVFQVVLGNRMVSTADGSDVLRPYMNMQKERYFRRGLISPRLRY